VKYNAEIVLQASSGIGLYKKNHVYIMKNSTSKT